jgi:hypothetical protein
MFGRFNEIDDQIGWREKLDDLRSSPPWVLERPGWMREGLGVTALLFVAIGFLMLTLVYVAVPPTSLPVSLPGHVSTPPSAAASAPKTTGWTPAAAKQLQTSLQVYKTPQARSALFAYLAAVAAARAPHVVVPPKPPTREWRYLLGCLALTGALLAAAWYLSETRARGLYR